MSSRALALCGLLGVAADPWPVRHTKTNAEGNQFLEANKAKTITIAGRNAGIFETASGLLYKQQWVGTGIDYPYADSACIVHFEAYKASDYCEEEQLKADPPSCSYNHQSGIRELASAVTSTNRCASKSGNEQPPRTDDYGCQGPQIDSSDTDGVALFTPSQMMAPIAEAMQMMVEGDKWVLYFDSPAEGPHSTWYSNDAFVFIVHIVQIIGSRNAKYSPPSPPPTTPPPTLPLPTEPPPTAPPP